METQAINNAQNESQLSKTRSEIVCEMIKKTKKQEPKIFPALMLVDKEAFEGSGETSTKFIMKQFWQSPNNKIIIAKK